MTDKMTHGRTLASLFALAGILAAAALGVITIYISGIGLLDPTTHRAGGFALALIAAIAASQSKRAAAGESPAWKTNITLGIDVVLLVVGLWSIWAFFSVQAQMQTALYDVTNSDVWPALAGVAVFLELCRRLWGYGVFGVGVLGVLYLLYGEHLPGLLEHAGFSMREIASALWYNTNKACLDR